MTPRPTPSPRRPRYPFVATLAAALMVLSAPACQAPTPAAPRPAAASPRAAAPSLRLALDPATSAPQASLADSPLAAGFQSAWSGVALADPATPALDTLQIELTHPAPDGSPPPLHAGPINLAPGNLAPLSTASNQADRAAPPRLLILRRPGVTVTLAAARSPDHGAGASQGVARLSFTPGFLDAADQLADPPHRPADALWLALLGLSADDLHTFADVGPTYSLADAARLAGAGLSAQDLRDYRRLNLRFSVPEHLALRRAGVSPAVAETYLVRGVPADAGTLAQYHRNAQAQEREQARRHAEEQRLAQQREMQRLQEEQRRAAEEQARQDAARLAEEQRLTQQREMQRVQEEQRRAAEELARQEARRAEMDRLAADLEAQRAAMREQAVAEAADADPATTVSADATPADTDINADIKPGTVTEADPAPPTPTPTQVVSVTEASPDQSEQPDGPSFYDVVVAEVRADPPPPAATGQTVSETPTVVAMNDPEPALETDPEPEPAIAAPPVTNPAPADYAGLLAKLGITEPGHAAALFEARVPPRYIHRLQAAGLTPTVLELLDAHQLGLDPADALTLADAGYRFSVADLSMLHTADVDPRYVIALYDDRFKPLTAEQLVQLWNHRVTLAAVRAKREEAIRVTE